MTSSISAAARVWPGRSAGRTKARRLSPAGLPIGHGGVERPAATASGGYGVKTGADALSDSHSFVIAARLPSSLIALIAALTHGVIGLSFARTALACSPVPPAGGANWPTTVPLSSCAVAM